jgi:peptidoglycan/LPS O-acetylase OafA/YrhL
VQVPKSIADKRSYDPAIDGLKGVAILMVIAFHVSRCVTSPFQLAYTDPLTRWGANGVSLFFVLSAFTLTQSSVLRFASEASPRSNFYVRRTFRILPLWWGYVFLSAYVRKAPHEMIMPHLLMYFGFLKVESFTRVGWSLFVEETFYTFFPLIFNWLRDPFGAVLFTLITLLLSNRFPGLHLEDRAPGWTQYVFALPLNHFFTFGLGILCFHLSRFCPLKKWIEHKYRIHLLDALSMAVLTFSVGKPSHGIPVTLAFFIVLYSAITPGTWIRAAMQWSVLRAFGVCCYSIYLFHALILFWFRYTPFFKAMGAPHLPAEVQMTAGFLIVAAITYLVGLLSFRYVELPCVQLGKTVISKFGALKTKKGLLKENPWLRMENLARKSPTVR